MTSLANFRELSGITLQERLSAYFNWQSSRRTEGTWVYDKTLYSAPLPVSSTLDGCGRQISGPNYCSQDYLSLASHPLIKEAAIGAIREFGTHSAGSSALLGNTKLSRKLEAEFEEFLGYEHVLLFPTGWAAGYGVVKGLVRPGDWVIMDQLSHACLQEGARAATNNVVSIPHLNNEAFEKRLSRIRANHPNSFVLAVTEGIFSMNSDCPDFSEFFDICRKYNAVSLVDVAHDLGCMGRAGNGQLEIQGCLHEADLLIGSFSKTFASNGGIIASKNAETKEYLKMYSCPQTFSNALSPVQVATVSAALSIIKSNEGFERREKLLSNSKYLRDRLSENGFITLGVPSAIVPLYLGEDGPARLLWKILSEQRIASNFVEFPGVATNNAIIRLQVQSSHEKFHAEQFVCELVNAKEAASNSSRAQ